MLEWLLGAIDASRPHEVGFHLSWHARSMVLAWAVLAPTGVIAARYFKVMPGQDWPHELDNRTWWSAHRLAQYSSLALIIVGMWLILTNPEPTLSLTPNAIIHHWLGYATLSLGFVQILSGWLRGSKGGPSDERGQMRGDHYDMTPRRRIFEGLHKTNGYVALVLAMASIATGLWQANAPRWIWISILLWWCILALAVRWLEQNRKPVSTYAAIWGNGPEHPGNRIGE